jgi:hypothetical protein
MLNGKKTFLLLIFVVLLTVGIITYAILRTRSVRKKMSMIEQAIDRGVGELGKDIDSVLVNIKTDTSYSPLKSDLEKLKAAKSSFYWVDKPENITAVFSSKTKGQIKAIVIAFESQYGKKFNDHLNDIFSDVTGYDSSGYQRVINQVQNAR